jgi:methyl acetate hydrolase
MSMKERIDSILGRAAQTGEIPGVVAMVTNREGTLYEGAFGRRVLDQAAAMTPDTVGWIASMTKAVTGAGAMQLVEQGRLDLDAPALRIVPEIANAQVLTGFDATGQPQTRPPKRPITLRHLLTHTAGFSYEIWNADIQKYQAAKGLPGVTTCENAALRTPLLFDPGERWDYGINIDWAGKMVEASAA